jgi:hypothetical protein
MNNSHVFVDQFSGSGQGRKFSRVLVAEDNGMVVGVLNAAQWPHCQLSVSEKLRTAPIMIREAGRGCRNRLDR